MKSISLNENKTLKHIWLPGVHVIPEDAVEVTDAVADELLSNPNRTYNAGTDTLGDYQAPFVLSVAKAETEQRMENSRDQAIAEPVVSSALGAEHSYACKAANRQFLNNLITLGNGGKFTCVDANGNKARLLHSHAQLLALAGDIEAKISTYFDHYEAKLAEISAATTQAELDAVVW